MAKLVAWALAALPALAAAQTASNFGIDTAKLTPDNVKALINDACAIDGLAKANDMDQALELYMNGTATTGISLHDLGKAEATGDAWWNAAKDIQGTGAFVDAVLIGAMDGSAVVGEGEDTQDAMYLAAAANAAACPSSMFKVEVVRKGVSGILLTAAARALSSAEAYVMAGNYAEALKSLEVADHLLGGVESTEEPLGCTPLAKMAKRAGEFSPEDPASTMGVPKSFLAVAFRRLKDTIKTQTNGSPPPDWLKRMTRDTVSGIKAELTVAPVQGALKYAALIDPKHGDITVSELSKERGEGYGYVLPVLSLLSACTKSSGSDAGNAVAALLSCPATELPSNSDQIARRSPSDNDIYTRTRQAVESAYICLFDSGGDVNAPGRLDMPAAALKGAMEDRVGKYNGAPLVVSTGPVKTEFDD